MPIHPTAIIDPKAELGSGVSVGPYSVIGPRVVVGPDTEIMAHVVIDKDTIIGQKCRFFPFASIGADPQDLKYQGEKTKLVIGDEVVVRESSTIHRGTVAGGGLTEIGTGSLIMATVHVAHDCHLGQQVILSSFAVLAGHVRVEEKAIVSGSSAIHQFVRIGLHSFIGGMSGIVKDVPPFMIVAGIRDIALVSPNLVGLRRHNFSEKAIDAISGTFKLLHNHRPISDALAEAESTYPDSPEVSIITNFYRSSERGVYR